MTQKHYYKKGSHLSVPYKIQPVQRKRDKIIHKIMETEKLKEKLKK